MRFLFTVFIFICCSPAWCQSALPVSGVELPYHPDSIAARHINYVVVVSFNPYENRSKMTVPVYWDSITFSSDGKIIGRWEKAPGDTAYTRFVQPCDSVDDFHYTRCDSSGRVITRVHGQDSWHRRYNENGDVVHSVSVHRPTESAEQVWISEFTYDSLGRPLFIYQRQGKLGWNYSTNSVDTTIQYDSYMRYKYENGRLVEIQHGLDGPLDPVCGSRDRYFYSADQVVRVEYSVDSERKRKPPEIHFMWMIRYGYAEKKQ